MIAKLHTFFNAYKYLWSCSVFCTQSIKTLPQFSLIFFFNVKSLNFLMSVTGTFPIICSFINAVVFLSFLSSLIISCFSAPGRTTHSHLAVIATPYVVAVALNYYVQIRWQAMFVSKLTFGFNFYSKP